MSAAAAVVYLVFSLCLHACSARPLGLLDKQETVKSSLRLSDKKMEEILPASRFVTSSEEAKPSNNFAAAEEDINDNKENKVEPSITEELQLKTADQKRKPRQMTESLPSDNSAEESMVSEKNVGEDIDVMDYAQAHRKPPIHNEEP